MVWHYSIIVILSPWTNGALPAVDPTGSVDVFLYLNNQGVCDQPGIPKVNLCSNSSGELFNLGIKNAETTIGAATLLSLAIVSTSIVPTAIISTTATPTLLGPSTITSLQVKAISTPAATDTSIKIGTGLGIPLVVLLLGVTGYIVYLRRRQRNRTRSISTQNGVYRIESNDITPNLHNEPQILDARTPQRRYQKPELSEEARKQVFELSCVAPSDI